MGELKQTSVYRISHREVFSKRTCFSKNLFVVAVMDLCSAHLACFSGF